MKNVLYAGWLLVCLLGLACPIFSRGQIAVDRNALPAYISGTYVHNSTSLVVIGSRNGDQEGCLVGTGTFPLLEIEAPALLLVNVTLIGGYSSAFGGCLSVRNVDVLDVINVEFRQCNAVFGGGGISIIPRNSLQLRISSAVFTDISTIYRGPANGSFFGAGAAVGVWFEALGNGSTILLENVVVANASQCLSFQGEASALEAVGGAFLFHWKREASGHAVSANISGLSLTNVTSYVSGTWTYPANVETGPIVSLGVLALFSGNHSGNGFRLSSQDIVMDNIKVEQVVRWFVMTNGAVWKGDESGNDVAASVSNIFLWDSVLQGQVTVIGLWWTHSFSGAFLRFLVTGIVEVRSVTMGQESQLLGVGWVSASSGGNSNFTLTEAVFEAKNCTLDRASFLSMVWRSEQSGQDSLLALSDGSTFRLDGVVGRYALLAQMVWSSKQSGHGALLKTASSSFIFNNTAFEAESSVFWMEWIGEWSGDNTSLSIGEGSLLSFENLDLRHDTFVAVMAWADAESGSNASMLFQGSQVNLQDVSLSNRASLAAMVWLNYAEEGTTTFRISSSHFTLKNVVSESSSPLFVVSSPNPAFEASFDSHSSMLIDLCDIGAIFQIYTLHPLLSLALDVNSITVQSSNISSIAQIFTGLTIDVSLFISQLYVEDSAVMLTSVDFPAIANTEGVLNGSSSTLHIEVSAVICSRSDLQVSDLRIPKLSALLNVNVSVNNLNGNFGKYKGVKFFGPTSLAHVDISMNAINLHGTVVQLMQVNGASGRCDMSSVTITNSTIEEPLVDIIFFDDSLQFHVWLIGTSVTESILAPGSQLFHLVSSAVLFIEEASLSIAALGSLDPLMSLQSGVSTPYMVVASSASLQLAVKSYSTQSDSTDQAIKSARTLPLTLMAADSGSAKLNGYFLTNSSYDPVTGASEVHFSPPSGLACPYGYSLEYNVKLSLIFNLAYTVSPYSCLNPFFSNTSSCDSLTMGATVTCQPCNVGEISFYRGIAEDAVRVVTGDLEYSVSTSSLSRCQACPSPMRCSGGPSDAVILAGHWVPPLPLLWKASNWSGASLSSFVTACPSGSCSPLSPMRYENGVAVTGTSLCTSGRDPSSALCSRCAPNSSATFFSDACTAGCRWGWRQGVAVAFVLVAVGLYITFLAFRSVSPQSPWIRIITYYYSVLNLLFESASNDPKNVFVQLSGILVTLSPSVTSHGSLAVCFPGLEPIGLTALRFIFPLGIVVAFTVLVLVRKYSRRSCGRESVRKGGEGPRLIAGYFSIVLLSYSSITGAVFAFLPCTSVAVLHDNDTRVELEQRLFVDGASPCWTAYPGAFLLLLFGLFVVFGVPWMLFVWQGLFPSEERFLYRLFCVRCRQLKRGSRVGFGPWRGMTVLYLLEGNLSLWYWDALLFLRRAMLEWVGVFVSSGISRGSSFLSLNLLFLALHAFLRPYKSAAANITEAGSLMVLCLLSGLNVGRAFTSVVSVPVAPFLPFLSGLESASSWIALSGFLIVTVPFAVIYVFRLRVVLLRLWHRYQQRRRRRPASQTPSSERSMELEERLLT